MFGINSTIILGLVASFAAQAQPKWTYMRNDHFHLYSSANERDTRATLEYFEKVRSFFLQMTGAPPANPVPVYIVAFNSEKEYAPFRFNEFALAYYASFSDRDYIVLGKTGEQTAAVVTHEYAHLVLKHAGFRLPPWLNEGLAEFFSTLRTIGSDIEYGAPILGRLQALSRERWVPLATLLDADHDSPYYNEKARAGSLYNQSWALVQFLATSPGHFQRFWPLVQEIQNGTPSIQAIERIYQQPLAKIENDLKFHIRSDNFRVFRKKMQVEGMEELKGQPANPFDVRAVQADLLLGLPGKRSEARARFEELSREDAQRPEPAIGLGYLAWMDGQQDVAVEHFARAFDLGARSPKLLWDFGRLAGAARPEQATAALIQFTQLEPTNSEALLTLANLYLARRMSAEALATALQIKSVKTVDERDRVLLVRATAALMAGERAEARARADELKRLTANPAFSSRADELLRYLNQPNAAALPPPPPVRADQPAQSAAARVGIVLQDIRGELVEMDCGNPARIILKTEQGRRAYLLLEPNRLIVTGREGGIQLACGPQSNPASLRLQFSEAPEDSDAAGVARALHF